MAVINILTGWVVGAGQYDSFVRHWDCIFYDEWQNENRLVRWTHILDYHNDNFWQSTEAAPFYNIVGTRTLQP